MLEQDQREFSLIEVTIGFIRESCDYGKLV
ncbi:unnamed protein product [Camellia sinensis]